LVSRAVHAELRLQGGTCQSFAPAFFALANQAGISAASTLALEQAIRVGGLKARGVNRFSGWRLCDSLESGFHFANRIEPC
jgi:hypothetical protein